jgi:transcriptional regulator with XRE-family HTH domain
VVEMAKINKSDFKKVIGKMLHQKRLEKKLTQAKTAEATGLSRSYICDIENGRYAPSVSALAKLAKLLELNLNFLSSNDGNTST